LILCLTTANLSLITAVISLHLHKKLKTSIYINLSLCNLLSFFLFVFIFILYLFQLQLTELNIFTIIKKALNYIFLVWAFLLVIFYLLIFNKKKFEYIQRHYLLSIILIFIYLLVSITPIIIDISLINYSILTNRLIIIGLFSYVVFNSLINRNKITNRFTKYYLISNAIIHTCLMVIFLFADINLIHIPLFMSNINIWITAFSVLIIIWCFAGMKTVIHIDITPHFSNDKNKYNVLKKKHAVSDREIEIIMLLLKGLSYKEIAYDLSISYQTVKTHINNIYRKCNLNSRIHLINYIITQVQ